MPTKYSRIDSSNTTFGERTYYKSYTLTSASTGVHLINLRQDSTYGTEPSAKPDTEGSNWSYIHNLFYRSGSSKNNADEVEKFNSLYHDYGQYHYSRPLFKSKYYNSGSVIYIPQAYFGERIKSGSFQLTARTGSASNDNIKIVIKDDGNGNLYSTNAAHSQSAGSLSSSANYIGNIWYDHGIVVLTETSSWSGSVNYTDVGNTSTAVGRDYRFWDVEFNSTLPIYTGQYSIRIKAGDFNTTMNESARGEKSGSSNIALLNLKTDLTGSGWSPYYNQIQLYRNQTEEPALIANLPRAIKGRDDVDIIITFRLDH